MLDKLTDFFKRDENFSERLKDSKNPFLGTLTLIWIIRNWQIVYAIFFDDREFLVRLEFIKGQIFATTFWEILLQFGINVLLAILAVIVIYILIYLTRFITNIFENRVLPWIYELSAPNKIVLKTEYDKLNKENKSFEERLEIEREKRIKAEAEIQRLEKKESDRIIENLTTPSSPEKEANDGSDQRLIDDVLEHNSAMLLSEIFKKIKNGRAIQSKDERDLAEELALQGFIIFDSRSSSGAAFYESTKLGDKLARRL